MEIWQNCNVFNDGVFDDVLAKEQRPDMLVPLVHGQPIRFGTNDDKGVVMGTDGQLRIVAVADVGEDALLVHDAHRDDPGLAFALAQLSANVHQPTPFGVFRQVERPEYATESSRQLLRAAEQKGSGDLGALLRSNGTWIGRLDRRPDAAGVATADVAEHQAGAQLRPEERRLRRHQRALAGGGADLGHRHRPQQHRPRRPVRPAARPAPRRTPCWKVSWCAHAGQGVVEAGRVEVARRRRRRRPRGTRKRPVPSGATRHSAPRSCMAARVAGVTGPASATLERRRQDGRPGRCRRRGPVTSRWMACTTSWSSASSCDEGEREVGRRPDAARRPPPLVRGTGGPRRSGGGRRR